MTRARPPSPNTSPATPPSSTSLRCPRSGASCRGAAWWFPSPTNGPARRGNASELPNQRWQADVTHWRLADHTEVEILDLIDDHSRLALASHARAVTTGPDVVDTFIAAFTIFTAKQRGDERTALEITLGEMGIKYSRSRPYHPQTCGKVERFHQTLKKHLRALPAAATITELQHQIDVFLAYYNNIRPHRALRRRTPIQAFNDRPKALPTGYQIPPHYRIRHDKIDAAGVITIRHNSRLHHIGLSKHLRDTKVTVLIDDLDIRVLHQTPANSSANSSSTPPATTNPAASNAETHPKTGPRCQ
jgi:transposase InsO family protein